MAEEEHQSEAIEGQAAQWLARLKTLPVSRATLEEFFAWKKIDAHQQAFDRVERLWSQAGAVGGSPAIQKATRAAYDKGHMRPRPFLAPKTVSWVAIAAGVMAFVMLGFWGHRGQDYATKVGEQRVVTLEDGSKVTLDTNTDLAVNFSKNARSVALKKGQAYFLVAHNAARPFTVDVNGTTVLATGTQFDIRQVGQALDVTLVEGSVRVTPPDARPTSMVSGQQLSFRPGRAPRLRASNITIETSWTQGRIVLDGMTLGDAIVEVNRYAAVPVTLDANRFSANRFSGTFETGDVQSFVAAATALLPLKAVADAHGHIHLIEITTKPDHFSSPS